MLINHPTFDILLINSRDPITNKSLINICNDNNYINMKEMLEQFIVDRNLNEVFANLNVISYEEEAGEVVGATE